jgi:hypothetical protein
VGRRPARPRPHPRELRAAHADPRPAGADANSEATGDEAARNTQRIQKALEDANIKLAGVVSDILGKSGRAVLDAVEAGETDPEKLVERTASRLKASREVLVESLRGSVREHHRFLIKLHLDQIDALNKAVRDLEARVDTHIDPFRKNIESLTTMPGISETAARVIVSEIGHDVARFPTAAHLISWAGLCARSDESAGKRRSSRIRHGAPWLKTTLVQCAWAAIRKKDSYLQAQFHRLKSRVGTMKAIIAVAASMLTAAFHMLNTGSDYKDLGVAQGSTQISDPVRRAGRANGIRAGKGRRESLQIALYEQKSPRSSIGSTI